MAGLSLSSDVHVFPCPACAQTINTSMQHCAFCAAPIDHAAAASSAETFAKINQSISDASYLKIMAGCTLTFLTLRFVPLLGLIGITGFWFLELAVPVMAIRWWLRYGKLQSSDPEFLRARRMPLYATGVTILCFALVTVASLLLAR